MLLRRSFLGNAAALAVACAEPVEARAPLDAEVVPKSGWWTVDFADEYGGDCVLADASTRRGGTYTWEVAVDPARLVLRDEDDYPMDCALVDGAFRCDVGDLDYDYADSGLDAVEEFSTWLDGTFPDETTLVGSWNVGVACDGVDCRDLGARFGAAFTYPCTAAAAFRGAWTD